MNCSRCQILIAGLILVSVGVGIGLSMRDGVLEVRAEATETPGLPNASNLPAESAAAFDPSWDKDYPQYQRIGKVLQRCPPFKPGELCPQDLSGYGGSGHSSYSSVDDVHNFAEFFKACSENKPQFMDERNKYMAMRYDFAAVRPSAASMTRGKPVSVGPVVRLPAGIDSWEKLACLSPEELQAHDQFPLGFHPLSHPLQTIGHQLFPQNWVRQHPEHLRFDVDFDIPETFLPEFPPPLFLSTRPDLGDVSKGYEVTHANYRELFDGIITPEQLEGLRLLVTKFPTTWFNQTKHRVTKNPVRGSACFDCHVNGHTNGAIAMDPAVRPTMMRTRVDTPTLRGANNTLVFSSRRSIRSLDHFSEVEEYFDGDISFQLQVGGRQLDRASTNRMGDFQSIVAWPPAPKLDRFGKLIAAKATEAELRGESLFFGKARCSTCHPAPSYTDNQLHDLKVEDFYHEGGMDQDILPARHQGFASVFARRTFADPGGYG